MEVFSRSCCCKIIANISYLFLLLFPGFATAQTEEIDSLLSEIDKREHLSGVVLVAQNGQVVFEKRFGMADYSLAIPNRIDTRFLLGSMTKQFTAMLVLQQIEVGAICLDSTVTTYLPGFRSDTGDKITIRNLLTHTHGIPDLEITERSNAVTAEEFVKRYCELDLAFEPGSDFKYSNVAGYFLLGLVLEKVSGKKYPMLLSEKILIPLNMKNTGYYSIDNNSENFAEGYTIKDNKLVLADDWDMSQSFSAAGMYSTAYDLLLWDRALRTDHLASRKSLDLMFSPYSENVHYGFGWYINDPEIDGVKRIFPAHVGGSSGYRSAIIRGLNDDALVIYLSNCDRYVEIRYPILNIILSTN